MRKRLLILALALFAMLPTVWAYDFSATSPSGHTLYYEIISGTTNVRVVRPGTGSAYDNYVTGNVVIPATVTYGGTTYNVTELRSVNNYYGLFGSCSGLTSVTIPNSVISIGSYAFSGCSGLTSVTIGNSVTSIEDYAFYSCSGLTSVTIPNSVTTIGSYAFESCSGLTSVTIGNSVTSIGNSAFYNCSGLTSVTIPNSVTSIGNDAFYNVRHIIYNGTATGSPWGALSVNGYIEGDFVYANNTKTVLKAYIGTSTSVTIPNSVTSIGNSAFQYCSGLTSVTIGNSVTSIGNDAFYGCSGLTSVTIPNSVTSIEEYAFGYCSGLTSVTIPNSVTSIGNDAFYRCSGLTSVTIPNSVTSIEDSAFIGCNNLYEVISLAILPPQLGEDIFPTTYMLKVPCGSANYYNSMASSWSQYFAEIEEMCNNITITVTSANESMGTVSGGGEYEVGTEITITATPNEGYHFVSWNDGNTDNPRTITVTEDATYIATFEEGVGIESRDMLSELTFYPNPTSGIITFNRMDINKVEVLDAVGRTVAVYENAHIIDISKLTKGYYTMRITTAEGVAVRKVVRN